MFIYLFIIVFLFLYYCTSNKIGGNIVDLSENSALLQAKPELLEALLK